MIREKLSTVIDSREANEEIVLESSVSSFIDFNTNYEEGERINC